LAPDDSHLHACNNITGATSDLCTITDTTYTAGDGLTLTGTEFNVTANGIGNDQLEYDTGQALTTTSNPQFNNVTVTDCIVGANGASLCFV